MPSFTLAPTLPPALLTLKTPEPLGVIQTISDVSVPWLSSVLHAPVTSFHPYRLGTGQIGDCYGIDLEYAEEGIVTSDHDTHVPAGASSTKVPRPTSLVMKLAAASATSRAGANALDFYAREVRFYNDIAPLLDDSALASCYFAAFDEASGTCCVLLSDARPAVPGEDLLGATVDHATLAVTELGHLQAVQLKYEGAGSATDWLPRIPATQEFVQGLWPGYLERYGSRILPEHKKVLETFIASFDAWHAARVAPGTMQGLVHGDFRLENMLFGQEGSSRLLTIVDWQTVSRGPLASDLSYFLGGSLTVEGRRTLGDTLIRAYHKALGPRPPLNLEQLKEAVRRQSFLGLVTYLIAPMVLAQTERGDELFMVMIHRHCAHILDVEALLTLPPPGNVQRDLRPDPLDERKHVPGTQPLWNESFYFDVADLDKGVGAWIRLGMTPNQPGSWYHALICGPNRPTVAVVDFEVPTPGDDLVVHTEHIHATHTIEAPMERARVTLKGRGESFDDPASILQGGTGRPVAVSLDLVWQTSGDPFKYQFLARYEIPCTVSGTITIDDEVIHFQDKAGQRDHSYGLRDWWSFDWVWSAFHLEDDTHFHGLDVRPHGREPLSAGYIQGPTQPITDLTKVEAVADVATNGMGRNTKITITPGNLVFDVEPIGHAPTRLMGKDGKVAFFPRSWAKVVTSDGRKGVGWIEWNINQ